MRHYCLEKNALLSLLTIVVGDRRIVFSLHDILVPFQANMASACFEDKRICLSESKTGPSTQFAPMQHHVTDKDKSAVAVVARFLAT